MSKNKNRGGPRKPRHANNFSSDIEMKDPEPLGKERIKSKPKNSSLAAKNSCDRRGRVGKHSASPPAFLAGLRSKPQKGGADGLDRWGPRNNSVTMLAPRSRTVNRRLSIISTASTTLSAQQAGPWCDKCASLNRRLHGYLLEILKSGEDAVDEWAYAVGASPDQMECEPAPERIIPEGFRRCSRQYQLCAAKPECDAATAMPPVPPGWSSTAYWGANPSQSQYASDQRQAVMSPYSDVGSGVGFVQRTHQPILPPPAGIALQNRHTLVSIPEHANSQPRWPGSSSQTPLPGPQTLLPPWNVESQRSLAVYPGYGPAHNSLSQLAHQQSHMPIVSSDHIHQQSIGVTRGSPKLANGQVQSTLTAIVDSSSYNEALRAIGQGRTLLWEQDTSDSEIPE
ncbi:hypothetical protein J7T55_001987 [Diaporthe amygdali]|uniref:uncharacterized protein n=1 Tax=Phomopsis amygdali TaxID=1214568 RepID=UPI0022FEAB7F|nr:uncharacterized protein J7T55_001987 [Diaporthe amygdali]KAJ0117787.1 hypothetical protein J7T55_001987 [Diaporthe amygdali]